MRKVILAIFVFLSFIQSSCNRCGNMPVHNANLDHGEQSFIPYKGDEVLKFLSKGDTFYLKGNGIRWTNERASSAGGDCSKEFLLAVKNYNFSDSNFTLIVKLFPSYGNNTAELFVTDISEHKQYGIVGIPNYDFNNKGFKYLGRPSDSVTILGKTYYKVYGYDAFIYNQTEGVLKFIDWTVGKIWPYPRRLFERIK